MLWIYYQRNWLIPGYDWRFLEQGTNDMLWVQSLYKKSQGENIFNLFLHMALNVNTAIQFIRYAREKEFV